MILVNGPKKKTIFYNYKLLFPYHGDPDKLISDIVYMIGMSTLYQMSSSHVNQLAMGN